MRLVFGCEEGVCGFGVLLVRWVGSAVFFGLFCQSVAVLGFGCWTLGAGVGFFELRVDDSPGLDGALFLDERLGVSLLPLFRAFLVLAFDEFLEHADG